MFNPTFPSPLRLQNFTTPNGSQMSVCCVCVQIWHLFTYVIEGIELKSISVCLINAYSLIADLHIFVIILNNFALNILILKLVEYVNLNDPFHRKATYLEH